MYTVVGGVTVVPNGTDQKWKDVSWDNDGDIEILRDEYKVDSPILYEALFLTYF